VEGKDIPFGLLADGRGLDVVVTDGFTGNVILKLSEGVSKAFKTLVEEEIKRDPISKLGGLLAKPAFYRVRRRVDWREYGGASLLGVDGIVVLTHGRSDSISIKNAIRLAKRLVEGKVMENIKRLFDECVIRDER
jgi:glycerol-3-phosphate acyltransferase PlsX